MFLRSYQTQCFCPNTFSNPMNAAFMAEKRRLAGRALFGTGGEKEKRDPELWQGLQLNRPTMLCKHLPAACAFFGKKIGKAASAPLASPAVLDISSAVVNPAVKVYICLWRNGCTAR